MFRTVLEPDQKWWIFASNAVLGCYLLTIAWPGVTDGPASTLGWAGTVVGLFAGGFFAYEGLVGFVRKIVTMLRTSRPGAS